MSFRKPCHMPFHKLIPPFTLTGLILFVCLFVFVNRFTRRFRCEKGYFGNPSKVGEKCIKLPGMQLSNQ